jgi:hypothetical protein
VVEGLGDESASAFGDLTGAFSRSYSDILAGFSGTFADVLCCAYRMQCDEVSGTLANAFSGLACAFSGAFADVAAAATDVASGASSGLRLGGWRRRGGRWRLLRRLAVGCHGCAEDQARQER